MKLLTHNMLQCHIKGVKNGYPFKIEAESVEEVEADYDPDFLRHIFPRIMWPALVEGAKSMGVESLPEEVYGIGHKALCMITQELFAYSFDTSLDLTS